MAKKYTWEIIENTEENGDVTHVISLVCSYFSGKAIITIDGDEYDIRVRYAPEFRTSIEDIENILIYNNMGKGVRIKDLGKVVESLTPPSISRKNRERLITVSGVVADGVALSDAVEAFLKLGNFFF